MLVLARMLFYSSGSLGRLLIPAAVAVVFGLARRYLPARKDRISPLEAIDSSGQQPYVNVAVFGMLIVIAFVSFFALRYLNWLFATRGPAPERILLPDNFIWMFFPLFGGLCLAWDATLWTWALFADKGKTEAYRRWSDGEAGFKATTILRWMTLVIGLPVGIASLLMIPVHDSFYQNEIAIGRFAHWTPEVHTYDSVREFKTVQGISLRDGSFQSQPTIILKFADGAEWSSWTTREDKNLNADLVSFLAARLQRNPETLKAEPFGN